MLFRSGTLAVGKAGAINAALLAVAILALDGQSDLSAKIKKFREDQATKILAEKLS